MTTGSKSSHESSTPPSSSSSTSPSLPKVNDTSATGNADTTTGTTSWGQGTEDDISTIHNCYCPNCQGGNAITMILPTIIPGFREIIITTLNCNDCHFHNSSVTFGGTIQSKGCTITLTINKDNKSDSNDDTRQLRTDLNRQLVKSDSCSIRMPALDLEIPSTTIQGVVTTIEGMLVRVRTSLLDSQSQRLRLGDIDNFHRCQKVIEQIKYVLGNDEQDDDDNDEDDENEHNRKNCSYDEDDDDDECFPFQIILDDPAGNSFIENPLAPKVDPQLHVSYYERSPTQDMALGLQPSKAAISAGYIDDTNHQHKNVMNHIRKNEIEILKDNNNTSLVHDDDDANEQQGEEETIKSNLGRQEVLQFPSTCPNCYAEAETMNMCVMDIPYFKEVIIMNFNCHQCNYRSNEIKVGGDIPKFGTRITLSVTCADDLCRDVLKSDTAGIIIPEIELELQVGGLGNGMYTTVEGLIKKMKENLTFVNPFVGGDSMYKHHTTTTNDGAGKEFSSPDENKVSYTSLLDTLEQMMMGTYLPFTLIIIDPLGNSFIGPTQQDAMMLSSQKEDENNSTKLCDEPTPYTDKRLIIEKFQRTYEQNEYLGLNDIQTENYTERERERERKKGEGDETKKINIKK